MPGGRVAEVHAERVRERDIADVRERRNDEALLDARIFVRVHEVDVADADDDVVAVLAPVDARLLEPLEVSRRSKLTSSDPVSGRRTISVALRPAFAESNHLTHGWCQSVSNSTSARATRLYVLTMRFDSFVFMVL